MLNSNMESKSLQKVRKKIHLSLHRDLDRQIIDSPRTINIPSFFKDLRTKDLVVTATSTTG